MAARQPLPKITIDEDVLTCAVCLEIFTNPKVLPCHHSFCEECLKTIVGTKSTLECPTCRNTCSLPEGGVMDLKPSFLINNILDSLVQQRDNTISDLCDTCQGGKPENRCVECNLRICGVCTSAHRKIPATTDHHVIPDKLSTDSMDESVQGGFCKTHKSQKLEFYCERCQIAICCECVLTKHKPPQHRRKSLKDAAASCKEKLQEYIMQMKIKQSEIQSSRVMAERIANLAERRYERELGKIKMQVQNVIENLFVEEKKLLTDLKIIYDGIKEIGHRQAGAFRSMEHLITSTLTAIELLELQDSPINVITALEETKDSMNYLKSVDTKPEMNPENFPKFSPADMKLTGRIGSISSQPRDSRNLTVESVVLRSETGTSEDGESRQGTTQHDDLMEQYRQRKKEQLLEQQRQSPQSDVSPWMLRNHMRQIQLYQYQRQKQKKQQKKK